MVFYDAEIAMILAVFFAVDAAQKHAKRRVPGLRLQGKILGLHSTVFSDAHDENATLSTRMIATAKVGLGSARYFLANCGTASMYSSFGGALV